MRREKEITIKGGRDDGKKFFITEMPAMQAEKWAARALLALGRSGLDIPDDFQTAPFAFLAAIGIRSLFSVAFDDAEPLMDEMWDSCVQIVEEKATRRVTADDVEELTTIAKIRVEVLELHTGFPLAEKLSELISAREVAPVS